jgi:hypothetical protein
MGFALPGSLHHKQGYVFGNWLIGPAVVPDLRYLGMAPRCHCRFLASVNFKLFQHPASRIKYFRYLRIGRVPARHRKTNIAFCAYEEILCCNSLPEKLEALDTHRDAHATADA